MQRNIEIRVCSLYNETVAAYPSLVKKLNDFTAFKLVNPGERFGPSDSAFSPQGPLGKMKVKHAHLNQDVSIFYRLSGNSLYLYGLFSHKESGTASTPQLNKQRSLAKAFSSQYPELKEYAESLAEQLENKLNSI